MKRAQRGEWAQAIRVPLQEVVTALHAKIAIFSRFQPINSHLQSLTKTVVSVGYGTVVWLMQGERSVRDVWGVYASSPVKATPPRLGKCDMKQEPSYATRRRLRIVILQKSLRFKCETITLLCHILERR